ncbi:MAG: enoyl-CoA hydratase-related protein [Bdellovibrionales bacterium]|nr:enoyl-CoA hydratase-related protein [Bdellovibrionales bacterium]
MKFQYLQFELSNKVAVLTINRPRALNALNSKVLEELEIFTEQIISNKSENGGFLTPLPLDKKLTETTKPVLAKAGIKQDQYKKEKNLHVLIITGAGKSFVAGADIKEMVNFDQKQAIAFSKQGQKVFSLIESLPIPVIAAINGFALGGGMELALACDILVISEAAKMGLPEVTLGLLPAFGGTQRLVRAVGMYKAKEIICFGKIYSAREFFTMGLGNKITSPEKLMKTAFLLAEDIKQRSPLSVIKSKKLIHEEDNLTLKNRLQKEAEAFGQLFKSPDSKEGMRAFLEKRKPQFKVTRLQKE